MTRYRLRPFGVFLCLVLLGLVGWMGYMMATVAAVFYGPIPALYRAGFVVVPVAASATYMVWFATRPPAMQRRMQVMTVPPIAVVSALYWTWQAIRPGLSLGQRAWLLALALPFPVAAVLLIREARQEAARARVPAALAADSPPE